MYNVILPTYNEADNIQVMISMLIGIFARLNTEYKLIIVDDNSKDGTADIVKSIMKTNTPNKQGSKPNIKLIERPGKMGLGSAYRDAAEYCEYSYTIIIDVDLQQNPTDIVGMAALCEKYDIVSSTRYKAGGKVCNWSFFRKLVSSTSNTLARFILDLETSDLTCSFRIYKTSAFKRLIKKVKTTGFGFQMVMIAQAEKENLKIKEYPIVFYDRVAGESKLRAKDILKFLGMVVNLYFTL